MSQFSLTHKLWNALHKLYEEIKYKLAIEANQDRKIYADLKQQNANGWIDSIIAKAKKEFL